MSKQIRAAIIGSTGYGGVELIRFLLHHPKVEITSVVSSSSAGESIAVGFPHLNHVMELDLDQVDIDVIQNKADVVFTATPSGVSSGLIPDLLAAGLKVIDLSGDYRLKSGELYEKWYKHTPPTEAHLQQAIYGLSEVFKEEIREAELLSNPGCYPTAASLGLIPALSMKRIDPKSIIIDAKSGASGAGRKLGLSVHYAELNENLKPYKVNQHQHIPEIEQTLSGIVNEQTTITFTTHLVPMTRGILCTMYADLLEPCNEQQLINEYRDYYKGRPFVRIRNKGSWPSTKEVSGSNYCDIGFSIDERTGRVTILSVIDNVVKGAAGQAIQNLNLMMGWDETTGLQMTPVYP
ncbi:N-acetyl-gamma-glutamyl-phosphate reductase [Chengkuizengella axinellae]|uniref:N-acetyl-gamma-glutamyl-phosphate reductase n=1 Tax=Chengkuizengella axinellae TaxID=3064388 RepID=A0ABT9J392_9BACL|nr:N-acetyl-gamma-glutamyl-phosphate reductase [Chengkuizengella sp. 2205SS18-9]MDP5275897.1 N-acetyl-gamma-glutamyl-phosphate reductase [Chengkuizengella sp. 2205SS18-9]